ncbi:MAG: hypothetical protein PUE58_02605, partial [Lachnospiraceae bacterium]|nr:hypothetical protein [Lachnospiraceae bacterium]
QWAAFTTSLNISSESGRTFGDACQLFYCIFAGILDMRKGRKPAWLLGFRLRLTTLVTGTVKNALNNHKHGRKSIERYDKYYN